MAKLLEKLAKQATIIYDDSKFEKDTASLNTQIRLLSLHPSTEASCTLIGELTIRKLQDPDLIFSALSYVWGDENVREPIVIHGINTTITRNLADALRCLRSDGKFKYVWADAVCINQHDEKEKEAQVAIMGEIYSRATRTYIWLGKKSDDSNIAMELVAGITKNKVSQFDPEAKEWLGVFHLLQRAWWTRLWIIQEAMLSKENIVKCGAKEVDLNRFTDLYQYWNHYEYQHTYFDKFNSLNIFHKVPFRSFMEPNTKRWIGVGLNFWLPNAVGFQCKLMRDRVYGVLSLAGPLAKGTIEITYSKDPITGQFVKSDRSVLQEANAVLFFELKGLTPLMMAHEKTASGLGLPSWCPDWTCEPTLAAVDYNAAAFPMNHFSKDNSIPGPWHMHENRHKSVHPTMVSRCAGWRGRKRSSCCEGLLKPELRSPKRDYDAFLFSRDLEILAVRGYNVDTIDFVGVTPWIEVGKTIEEQQQSKLERAGLVREAVRGWEKHVEIHKTTSYSNTNNGSKEAFWRTLIANRDFDMEDKEGGINPGIPTHDFEQYFDAWMGRGPHAENSDAVKEYSRPAILRCTKRAFITTTKGYFGLAPAIPTQEPPRIGDMVCILRGAKSPCILRPFPDTNYCTFEGFAYVHGIMEGEYLRHVKIEDLQEFWIR